MRRVVVVLALSVAPAIAMATAGLPRALTSDYRAHALACSIPVLSCGMSQTATFNVSGCRAQDGSRADYYDFAVSPGTIVTITLQAIDATLKKPALYLFPSDTSLDVPAVMDGLRQTIRAKVTRSGVWEFGVFYDDPTSTGRYNVWLTCSADPSPSDPAQCVMQVFECEQTVLWSLGAKSCSFSNDPTHQYAYFDIYLQNHRAFTMTMTADYFSPRLSVYKGGGMPLQDVTGPYRGPVQIGWTADADAHYQVTASSGQAYPFGSFTLSSVCSCDLPAITGQPQPQSVPSGQVATVVVGTSGTPPLAYQWYYGTPPDTSRPFGANTPVATVTVQGTPVSVWVRVSNACGHADSAAAVITPACTPPSISVQPQSKTLKPGEVLSVTVIATGSSPLTYQWYYGAVGDTSHPFGSNTPSASPNVVPAPVSVWVRISNPCGVLDSAAAVITPSGPAKHRSARH